MGTTEVQRTLVKSPPELWSELSDQGSLGRLLSDLGEVRIVSTVADSAVYWEGDEVTGSALLKQAGWGTKVTLTVTLATPDTSPTPSPAPVLAAVGAPVASAFPLTAAALRATAEPSSPQPGTGPTSSIPALSRPQQAIVPGTATETPDHPATSPVTDTPDPPAAAAAPVPGTESPDQTAARADAPDRTSEDGEPTRRGFFARLFGRRSRRREEPVPSREQTDPGPSPEPDAQPDTPATALEALQARYGVRPAAEPSAPTAATPVPAAATAEPSAPTPSEPAQAAGSGPKPAPTPPEPSAAMTPQAESPESDLDPATPPDLSSELRSAEEIPAGDVKAGPTEDQVKEILTGVLDRLGAAHHRPFSRA